jgi:hypothetical protein
MVYNVKIISSDYVNQMDVNKGEINLGLRSSVMLCSIWWYCLSTFRNSVSVLPWRVKEFKENVGHSSCRLQYVTFGDVKDFQSREPDYLFPPAIHGPKPDPASCNAASASSLARHSSLTACPLKLEQMRCPETSVNNYRQTLRDIPK